MTCYNVFGTAGFAVFSLNACGQIDQNSYYAVSPGDVDSTPTSNVTTGTTVTTTLSSGVVRFNRQPPNVVSNHSIAQTYCGVDTAVQQIISNQVALVDTGIDGTVVFSQTGTVQKEFALVIWVRIDGTDACGPDAIPRYAVEVYPRVTAGTVDRTVVNNTDAVTFVLSNATTVPVDTPLDLALFANTAGAPVPLPAVLTDTTGATITNFDFYFGDTPITPPATTDCTLVPVTQFPITSVVAGAPGGFVPSFATPPANLAALQTLGALSQTTAWSATDYVTLGDGSNATWNGTAWTVFTVAP